MSAPRLHPEKEQFAPLSFTPASGVSPRDNLSAFIRMARDDINGLTKTFDWSARAWRGIGVFCPLGALRKSDQHEALSLHPEFADFAKAIVCYFFAQLPSQKLSGTRLAALRCLHSALMDVSGSFDPLEIDIITLDRAAALARDRYSHSHAYAVGRQLEKLARFLSQSALTWRTTGSWRSPIGPAKDIRQRAVGLHRDSDEYRKTRLPSEQVLEAVGSVFARGFDLDDPRTHADVYVTSTVAMLMAGSSRVGEIHELTADLEVWENDPDGKPQYGWRFRSFKSRHQSYRIKWIPEEWRPIAQEAIQRIRRITEGPRAFARYVESQLKLHETSPDAPLRFYRHLACPDVADDQPLTAAQAATALAGRVVDRREAYTILNQNWNLINADNAHTLDSLWQVVLNRLPRGFPFVSHAKNVRLKYSEALFCMRKSQLKRSTFSSPVTLWIPSNHNLNSYLGVQRNCQFFAKHGFFDDQGRPLTLQTHKIRHLLDTIAQASVASRPNGFTIVSVLI